MTPTAGSSEEKRNMGLRGAMVVVAAFLLNEVAIAFFGPTMVYIALRSTIIPFGVGVFIMLTVWQILRFKITGQRLISPVIALLVAVGILLFQWFSSYPLFAGYI